MSGRKGFNSFASIPPAILCDLNAGVEHPVTLAEWLAIDPSKLLKAVLPDLGLAATPLKSRREKLVKEAKALSGRAASERSAGMGAAFHRALKGLARREALYESIAGHPSPMVRSWAAYSLLADERLTLSKRLRAARRFAADEDMSVRECAWVSFRAYVAKDLPRGLKALVAWAKHDDPNLRRCAVEATRPRGVWTEHIASLKEDPEPGLVLLEPVRSDASRYVQTAVGNWINDASKSRPDWAEALCRRWVRVSPTPETIWTVRHGLRTLRKARSKS